MTPDSRDEALESCKWCDKGDRPNFLDQDGTLVSITGEDGILCHAHEEYWWPCLKFGVELRSSRASVAAVEGDADKKSGRVSDTLSSGGRLATNPEHKGNTPPAASESPLRPASPSCDYRNAECSSLGVVVGNKWICDSHRAAASSPAPAEPPHLLEKAIAQTRDCVRCAPLVADTLKEKP